jgi:hypothetical protein
LIQFFSSKEKNSEKILFTMQLVSFGAKTIFFQGMWSGILVQSIKSIPQLWCECITWLKGG